MEETLKKLIKINSVSGSEKQIESFIFNELKNYGLPKWIEGNVVFKIQGINQTKALILNAHVDTVSAGELASWEYPPFGEESGVIKDGKIYGLGASDEKCAVVVLIELAKTFQSKKPDCDIWLTFVISEETTGLGSKSLLRWFAANHLHRYKKVAGVLLEPTGLEHFEIGHRGNVFIKLTTKGDGGHGSKPDLVKTHAVFAMFDVLNQMKKIEKKWQQKYKDELLGVPTIAIATSIRAGDSTSPNKIGDVCTATMDIRTTPKLHPIVLAELKKELIKHTAEIEYLYQPAPLGLTDKSDDIVQAIKNVIPVADMKISQGATDQCFFTETGIPAIVFGPGEKKIMHRPNEYCELKKVTKCISLVQKLITEWNKI